MKFTGKIKYVLMVPLVYRNFLKGFLSGFGLLDKNKECCWELRNGLKICGTGSKWTWFILNEVFIKKEYAVPVSNPATIIDIGANIGAASLFFAKRFPDAVVYAFEPFEKNFSFLKKNIEINDLQERVIPVKKAVGDSDGELNLYLNCDNDGCHSLLRTWNPQGKAVEVPVITLDNFIKEKKINKIDLLKIDCEGMELKVLQSIKDFSLIKNIVLEAFSGTEKNYSAKIISFLEKKGFIIEKSSDPVVFAHRIN